MAGFAARLARIFGPGRRDRVGRRVSRLRPGCEAMEPRSLLTASGLGADYTLMGGAWDASRPITYSIAPDGVAWDQGTNDVNARLNAAYGGTAWRASVARALQTWAVAANLNFVPVGDGSFGFNAPGEQQGDPRFGDIRIGGYDFGPTTTVAQTYGPPPNGQTGAGEVELDTANNFAPGSKYDLQTIALHELGHSLGLGESPRPSSIMYTYYSGVRQSLSPYDVEGIRAIYGPRAADRFQAQGRGVSPATAVDLTPSLSPDNQGELAGVSLDAIGDVEYFSVTAPRLGGATMRVAAQASGYSLLSPKISVIDPSTGASIATDAHPDRYGDLALASVPNVQPGHRYLIAVSGATGDAFAVGSYAAQVGFSGGTPLAAPAPAPVPVAPTPAPIPVPTAAPAPVATPPTSTIAPDRFAASNSFATAAELGPLEQTTVNGLSLPTARDLNVFAFETTRPGVVLVASVDSRFLVADSSGRLVTSGTGLIGFAAPTAGARYYLIFLAPGKAPVPSFGFDVVVIPTAPAVVRPTPTTPFLPPQTVLQAASIAIPARSHRRTPHRGR